MEIACGLARTRAGDARQFDQVGALRRHLTQASCMPGESTMSHPAVLYFRCGKMGAGKSTLAESLASDNGAVLLSGDALLREL